MPGTTPQGLRGIGGGIGRGTSSLAVAPSPRPLGGTTSASGQPKGGVGVGKCGPRRTIKAALMTGRFTASGVTRDAAGVAVAGATVTLYQEGGGPLAWTVSDGSGAFFFDYVGVGSVFVRATKPGSPELAGTTLVFAPVSV